MHFHEKKGFIWFHEFFCLDFFNFSGPLWNISHSWIVAASGEYYPSSLYITINNFFQTLRDCDQLFFPNQNILAPFGSTLTKAPQGLTTERSRFLSNLSKSLAPTDRIISLIIDEALLTPKMTFDSNGMIIGM